MRRRRKTDRISVQSALSIAVLMVSSATAGAEDCWSLLKTPDWPKISASLQEVKLCEKLPGGPDRTRRFEATRIDLCSAPQGVTVRATVSIKCGTSDAAFPRFSVDGDIAADVTVDIGACRINAMEVRASGAVGQYLSSSGLLQGAIQAWGQNELNRLCGKR